jgi:hypothetical protein
MKLKVFHLRLDFDCNIHCQVNNQNKGMNCDELPTESQIQLKIKNPINFSSLSNRLA